MREFLKNFTKWISSGWIKKPSSGIRFNTFGITAAGVGTALTYAGAAGAAYSGVKSLASSGKKGKGGGMIQPVPYSGYKPPAIDTDSAQYLRPTQDELQRIVMARAQGDGVGYDPARKAASIDLLKSQIGQQSEDDVRDARGSAAASGLGGNLAAQGALEGRVRRDSSRNLAQGLDQITIDDLTRANQERDTNTSRLQQLNATNFGQENTRANFDLGVYNAENGQQAQATTANNAQNNADRTFNDQQGTEAGQLFGNLGSSLLQTKPQTGVGIAPIQNSGSQNAPSDTLSALTRAKQKRSQYYPGVNSIYQG